jgi:hypothetical protein
MFNLCRSLSRLLACGEGRDYSVPFLLHTRQLSLQLLEHLDWCWILDLRRRRLLFYHRFLFELVFFI